MLTRLAIDSCFQLCVRFGEHHYKLQLGKQVHEKTILSLFQGLCSCEYPTCKYQCSYTYSRQKLKDFSRTFQDPAFKIQGLFFIRIHLQPRKKLVSVINTCTRRKSLKTHTSNSGSIDMRESNKRALGTKNEYFRTFCKHFENFILCLCKQNQGLSRTKTDFRGFSRRVRTL